MEKDWISEKFPISLQQVKRNLTCRECQFPEEFDLEKYQLFQGDVQSTFSDGEIFNLGERTVQVVHTRDIHRDITAFRFQQIWQTGLKVHAEN